MIPFIQNRLHRITSDEGFSEILKGSIWSLIAKVFATGLAMVTTIVIARLYGAEVLGIVAVLNSVLVLATILTLFGTDASILRLITEHFVKYSATSAYFVYCKILFQVAGISILIGTLLFFASGFIADTIFSKPHLGFYFALAAFFLIFKSLMIYTTQSIRGLRHIRAFAFIQIMPSFSKLLVLILMTTIFFHQNNPIYAMFASLTITAMAGVWYMHRAFKEKLHPNDTVQHMSTKDILSLSLPMLMTTTMTFIIGQTGVIMLGIYRSEADVGYYAVAVKLATLTSFVLQAINTMAAPKFSNLFHSGQMDELFRIAKKSTKLIFWSTVPILLCLILFGNLILSLLFGADFKVAYIPMIFLVVGQFVNSCSGSTGFFMNMTGLQNVLFKIKFISAVLNIFINLVLTPTYGLYGASFAAMVSIAFWNIYTLIYIKWKHGRTIGYIPFFSKV